MREKRIICYMASDLYEGFAERYDLFSGRFAEHDDVEIAFYKKLFKENNINDVLDCACGTGKDLHLFHSLGCRVVGSDISESMLEQAKKNLKETGINIPLHKVDYRELPRYFDERFDGVMCLSTSIAHMQNEEEVLKAFTSMYNVLKTNGMLILTQGTTDKQWNEKPRFILAVNEDDFSRIFVIDYLEKGARYNVIDLYHSKDNSDMKVWGVEYSQMLLRDDQEKLLMTSGFRKVDFYGSYRFEPYDKKESSRLITVAYR